MLLLFSEFYALVKSKLKKNAFNSSFSAGGDTLEYGNSSYLIERVNIVYGGLDLKDCGLTSHIIGASDSIIRRSSRWHCVACVQTVS
jgi:hypothetical protein